MNNFLIILVPGLQSEYKFPDRKITIHSQICGIKVMGFVTTLKNWAQLYRFKLKFSITNTILNIYITLPLGSYVKVFFVFQLWFEVYSFMCTKHRERGGRRTL